MTDPAAARAGNHDELIDQLIEKMEDSEIDTRLKASQRLTSLAKLVGPVKTRTALLPKLHGACSAVARPRSD